MANAAYSTPVDVADWLADRKTGIGSSDAAAIVGLDRYRTPLDIYLSKVDPVEPTGGLPEPGPARWGLLLEPAVARGYELETGHTLTEPAPARHKRYPFIGATADRIRADGTLVEIKTASLHMAALWGEPGSDVIPDAYLCQVQHQLAVYDAPAADVAVLIAGSDFRIYHIPRCDEAIESLLQMERDFWAMVEAREAPEPEWGHDHTPELIGRLHKPIKGKEISLPDEALDLILRYDALGQAIKESEEERQEVKARLIHQMGDAGQANVCGYSIRRNQINRKEHVVKASTFTDFRIVRPKPLATRSES